MSRPLINTLLFEAEKFSDTEVAVMKSQAGAEVAVTHVTSQGGVRWTFFTYFEPETKGMQRKSRFILPHGLCHAYRQTVTAPAGEHSAPPRIPTDLEILSCAKEDMATEHELSVLLTALQRWEVVT